MANTYPDVDCVEFGRDLIDGLPAGQRLTATWPDTAMAVLVAGMGVLCVSGATVLLALL